MRRRPCCGSRAAGSPAPVLPSVGLPAVAIPPCDAVVAVGEVLNYMPERAACAALFARVFRALTPGGLFVFDAREPGRGGPPVVRGCVGRDRAVLTLAIENPARGTLVRAITSFRRVGRRYRRADEIHRLTLLPAADVARRLRTAGFRVRIARAYAVYEAAPRTAPGCEGVVRQSLIGEAT